MPLGLVVLVAVVVGVRGGGSVVVGGGGSGGALSEGLLGGRAAVRTPDHRQEQRASRATGNGKVPGKVQVWRN